MKQIYIAWVAYQRRPDSMRSAVGYALHFVAPPFTARWLKPLGYFAQAWRTLSLLLRERPDVVWFQQPPNFLAHLLLAARALPGLRFKLVADCHNAALRPPWLRFPGTVWALNRMDRVLAHNAEVEIAAGRLGIDGRRLRLLETRPATIAEPLRAATRDGIDGAPTVLVPSSFAMDEPTDVLLRAAAMLPELRFVVTGRLAKARAKGFVERAPANVRFTDYLALDEFNGLLLGCDLVLGLTTIEGIQLSVANEAIGAGKPLVLSDTTILRELFGAAGMFTPNEAEAMAGVVREALGRLDTMASRAAALREMREARWTAQLQAALKGAGIACAPTATASGPAGSPTAGHQQMPS